MMFFFEQILHSVPRDNKIHDNDSRSTMEINIFKMHSFMIKLDKQQNFFHFRVFFFIFMGILAPLLYNLETC